MMVTYGLKSIDWPTVWLNETCVGRMFNSNLLYNIQIMYNIFKVVKNNHHHF